MITITDNKIPELTAEERLLCEQIFNIAIRARLEFQNTGYAGLEKPEYPLFNGKPINNSAKNSLDKYYNDARSMGWLNEGNGQNN